MRIKLSYLAAPALCALAACNKSKPAGTDTTIAGAPSASSSAPASDTSTMVRGSVTNATATQLVVQTDSGSQTVMLTQPVQVFERGPGTLADVKSNSFIGVTSVKQPDGSEKATEIHIFPEALRGLGEGSRMMTQGAAASGSGSRMTNGSVSDSQMTNGTASGGGSRMSNGSVASTNGSTMTVQYNGGSQTITIPPNVTVTEIKASSKQPASGDQVVVLAKKNADGSLSSNRVMFMSK